MKVPWTSSSRQKENLNNLKAIKYRCDELLCSRVFENEDDLLNHLKFQNHKFPEIRQTIGDVARMEFLKQKDVLTATSSTISTVNICPNEEDKNTFFRVYAKGFGRRKIKKSRFNEKQKDFVGNLFEEGEKTKIKYTLEYIATALQNYEVNGKF